jgi:soluble lytic murein transglycosylase
MANFDDFLDKVSQYYTKRRNWKTLADIYNCLKGRFPEAAQYGYILGRAIEEGYAEAAELGLSSKACFQGVLDDEDAPLYYRVLAVGRLGREKLPMNESAKSATVNISDNMAFILGFFKHGLGEYALQYLNRDKSIYSEADLRALAQALAKEGRWDGCITTLSYYITRPGYRLRREDMELFYPRPFKELIEKAAGENAIPKELFFALVRTESAFVPANRSSAGAQGLTQLMPATAADMARRLRFAGKLDLHDPAVNLPLGAAYLDYLRKRTGSTCIALLAYNGGMGRLRRWRAAEASLPEDLFLETVEYPETRDYGRRVLSTAAAYGYLYYAMSMKQVIADIYRE